MHTTSIFGEIPNLKGLPCLELEKSLFVERFLVDDQLYESDLCADRSVEYNERVPDISPSYVIRVSAIALGWF